MRGRARAEGAAGARSTALWLRGREAPMSRALTPLGAAIASNRARAEHDKSFLGRLGALRLDLTHAPVAGLDAFRTRAAFQLRDERLGPDAKLGLRLQVRAARACSLCFLVSPVPSGTACRRTTRAVARTRRAGARARVPRAKGRRGRDRRRRVDVARHFALGWGCAACDVA